MRILLGISAGIAAYKTPDLLRQFQKAGHEVRCVLTSGATRLVAKDALAALSGSRVYDSMWSEDGRMPHIDLARWAEVFVIAPTTADCLARLALGLADDLLTTLELAMEPEKRRVLAPAMNTVMWQQAIVQTHVKTLRERGAHIIDPIPGDLACGETGVGAMAEASAILAALH